MTIAVPTGDPRTSGSSFMPELRQAFIDAVLIASGGTYNVLDPAYGAVGDAIWINDAAITSGTPTLTSAGSAFTTDDIGKKISVRGAGTAGATLRGTIIGRPSSTSLTLSLNAATTVTAQQAVYGTDDTAAFIAAKNAAKAGDGGTVVVPTGFYYLTGQILVDGTIKFRGDGWDEKTLAGVAGPISGTRLFVGFDIATATFTADSGTDVITITGVTPTNGASVQVSNSGGALPAPLVSGTTTYFLRDVSGNTAKLATTPSGAAINLTTNGTGTNSIQFADSVFIATVQGAGIEDIEFYCLQTETTALTTPWAIHAYRAPFTVAGGDGLKVRNVMIRNLSHGIKINADRCVLDRIYGQPMITGIYLDGMYDAPIIKNVHFWVFWAGTMVSYTLANATGLLMGRVDGPRISNFFVFGYFKAIDFEPSAVGINPSGTTARAQLSNIYLDNVHYGIYAGGGFEAEISNLAIYCASGVGDATTGSRGIYITSGAIAILQITSGDFTGSDLEAIRISSASAYVGWSGIVVRTFNVLNVSSTAIYGATGSSINAGRTSADPATGNGAAIYGGGFTFVGVRHAAFPGDANGIGIASPTDIGTGGGQVLQVHKAGGVVGGLLVLSSDSTASSSTSGIMAFGSTGLSGSDKRIAQISAIKADASTVSGSGRLNFLTWNAGTPTIQMRIDEFGKVGVGTASPVYRLHVVEGATGNSNVAHFSNNLDTLAANSVSISLARSPTHIMGQILASNEVDGTFLNGYMDFLTRTGAALTSKMRINSLGNVSIPGSLTVGGLTSGRVPFASTAGLLTDDSDLTFSVDTLTSTKLIGSTSVSTPSLIAAANLTAAPVGDWIFNPGGKDILPSVNYDLNIGALDKKYLTLHAAELWVETLVAQDTLATIGGRILVGPTTQLTSDLTTGATSITVKHNQMVSGDRVYMEANGKVEFMAITSAPSGSGPYVYTVTRDLDGSGANVWNAGDAIFNTGQTGNGFIDLYSLRGVKSSSEIGPTIVGNVRNSATYNDWSEHWAIGNLNGKYGYSSTIFGVGLGKYASGTPHITIDATSGYRQYLGTSVVLYQVDNSGNVKIGTNVAAANTTNIFVSNASQTYNSESFVGGDVLFGDNTAASNVGNIKITGGEIKIRRGVTDYITLNATEAQFTNLLKMKGTSSAISIGSTPPTSASAGTGIWLDRTGMFGLASSVVQASFDATTGKISAAAGAVLLDVNGITIKSTSSSASYLAFQHSATVSGGFFTSAVGVMNFSSTHASSASQINLVANSGGTGVPIADFTLTASPGAAPRAYASLWSESGTTVGFTIGANSTPSQMLDVRGKICCPGSTDALLIGTSTASAANYSIDIRRAGFTQLYVEGDSTTAGAADFILKDVAAATNAKMCSFRNQAGIGSFSSFTDAGAYQKQSILSWDNLTGSVMIGLAALATTATDGFLYIPTCAGAPTGTPTAKTGRVPMIYDSTNNKFYIYSGAWKSVTLT